MMDIIGDDIGPAAPPQPTQGPATAEVEQLLHYMPIIARAGGITDWTRQFAISMAGRMKRGQVRPTVKQVSVMRKMVAEFQAETIGRGGDA